LPFVGDFRQHHSTYRYTESVGAVGAVFEEVFFALGEFFADLSLRKPLRPRQTPANGMTRIRSGLLERLKNGMRHYLSAKPWSMRR